MQIHEFNRISSGMGCGVADPVMYFDAIEPCCMEFAERLGLEKEDFAACYWGCGNTKEERKAAYGFWLAMDRTRRMMALASAGFLTMRRSFSSAGLPQSFVDDSEKGVAESMMRGLEERLTAWNSLRRRQDAQEAAQEAIR